MRQKTAVKHGDITTDGTKYIRISSYNERSSPLLITMSSLESVPLARSIMRGIATSTIGNS